MIAVWWFYIGGRLAAHIYLTKRDRRAFARGYRAGASCAAGPVDGGD